MNTQLPRSPIPMFPLPGVFLYPAQILPLHVFEGRYRQLVEDSLDGPGRILLPTVIGEGEPAPLLPVAGLGEIVRHEKLDGGRFHIWLLGLSRVHLDEVASDRPYRMGRCLPFPEVQAQAEEAQDLQVRLREATSSRWPDRVLLPQKAPTAVLTDLLAQTLPIPPDVAQDIFVETSVAERARKVLQAHERYPFGEAEL